MRLWAFRGAPPADRARFLDWFLEGYLERAPIADQLIADFSWFIRLRSLSLFLRRLRLRAMEGRNTADDPWADRMRAGFDAVPVVALTHLPPVRRYSAKSVGQLAGANAAHGLLDVVLDAHELDATRRSRHRG